MGVALLEFLGLFGDFLLQFLQVGGRVLRHRLVAGLGLFPGHRLVVAQLSLGLFGLFLGLLGLFERLGDFIGRVFRGDFVRLQLGLLVGLGGLLVRQRLGDFLLGFLQIVGGFVPVLGGGVKFFVIEVLLGGLHLFLGRLNLLAGLGDGFLQGVLQLFGLGL